MAQKETANPSPIRLLSLVFFLSGAAALIFESVWFHSASLSLGSSVISAAAVLMAFMGGLAIGNTIVAFRGHGRFNPFLLYAAIEIVIGMTGVIAVFVLPNIGPHIAAFIGPQADSAVNLTMLRFIVALAILLVPAVAMGMTLPVLQKGLRQYHYSFCKSLALLYGWNTIGAVFGVLVAEFILVVLFGVTGAAAFACVVNFAVALIIIKKFSTVSVTRLENENTKPGSILPNLYYLLPAFCAGFLLLALEIVWFRYMTLAHAGTSTVFSVMLAIVLAGIGAGGLIVIRLKTDAQRLDKILPVMLYAAGLCVVISFAVFNLIFTHKLNTIMFSTPWFVISALVLMLPVSLMSGMLFPLFGEFVFRKFNNTTFSSGMTTLANTTGAAVGSCVATFVLLPNAGVENSFFVLSLGYIVLGIFLVAVSPVLRTQLKYFGVSTLVIIIAVSLFPHGAMEKSYQVFGEKRLPGWETVQVKEGVNETIQYFQKNYLDSPIVFRMMTNSFSMAGTGFAGSRYMKLYAYFPYVFKRDIKDVLQISYGVGNTAEAITSLESIQHYDVVDISRDVLALSNIVHGVSGHFPLQDPRTNVHIEDGRFFLQTTKHRYDLITGEPPPPKIARVVNLYTQEYFSLVHDRLNDKGMVSYWLPVHQLAPMDTLAIIKSFCMVFHNCSLWTGIGLEFMLIGTRGDIPRLNMTEFSQPWQSEYASKLKAIGIEIPQQIATLFLADSDELKQLTSDVLPLTDNYPKRLSPSWKGVSEYSKLYAYLLDVDRRKDAFQGSAYIKKIVPAELIDNIAPYFRYEDVLLMFMSSPYASRKRNFWDEVVNVLANTDFQTLPVVLLGSSHEEQVVNKVRLHDQPASIEFQFSYGVGLLANRKFDDAARQFLKYSQNKNTAVAQQLAAFKLHLVSLGLNDKLTESDLEKSLELGHDPLDQAFRKWLIEKFLS